jgi:ribose 5-phosphate isomerase B
MLTGNHPTLNIAIGSDHRGLSLKQSLIETIVSHHEYALVWHDVGCHNAVYADYPLYASSVCNALRNGLADYGILICGTGAGMSIAANRFSGIYAALVWNEETARLSKEHDNANIIVLPADFITSAEALVFVRTWLGAHFLGGRHQDRLALIDEHK